MFRNMLYVSFVIASVFSFEATSQVYNFAPSDFTIVWQNSYIDTLGLYGYQYQGEPNGFHQYRLTLEYDIPPPNPTPTAFPGTSCAMWHNQKIDLSESFIFSCSLNFGGISDNNGGFGFCLVLHQKNPSNLIGYDAASMGYAYLYNNGAGHVDSNLNRLF